MREDQKNLLLAMALSLMVILGWNYFYGAPKLDAARQTQQAATNGAPTAPGVQPQAPAAPQTPAAQTPAAQTPAAQAPGVAPTPAPQPGGAPVAPAPTAPVVTRDQALAAAPRVAIDTPSLAGSINLRGARFDDLRLKHYRETIKPNSGVINLLNPAGGPETYFIETGFVAAPGANILAPGPDTVWTAQGKQLTASQPLELTWDNGQGLVFRRTISVDENYMFTVRNTVENKGAAAVTLYPYALTSRVGRPKVEGYIVLHEGLLGVVGDSRIQEYTYDAIEKEPKATRLMKGAGGWIGITDKYWATAIAPDQSASIDARFSASGPTNARNYQADLLEGAREIPAGQSAEVTHRIFAGAKESQLIDSYQDKFGIKNFELMIDWGWFYFITKPLFWLIDFIYRYVGNFGVAILAVTVVVKLAFFPLANRSYESMAKMKAVQPEMKALQERYADDKQQLQKELMELYKREKINPVAGCLPVLIQIPVFFALYKVIFITIEMRHAPFFGWIHDLSAPDPTNMFNLFGLLPFDPTQIPLMGAFLWIGVWPLLMGVSMFVQMKMNPEPTDPIQKAMFAWMPVIFTFMLGAFPAGLVIYWTWNNVLSLLQQYYIMKRQGVKIELWDNLSGLFRKKPA